MFKGNVERSHTLRRSYFFCLLATHFISKGFIRSISVDFNQYITLIPLSFGLLFSKFWSNPVVSWLPRIIMDSSSVELFQFVRRFHQTIGIYASQSNGNQCSTKSRRTICFISSAQFRITTFGYLPFEASTMFEYGFGFFALVGSINCLVIYSIFIWQSENTLKFIESCEGFIRKSEHHSEYRSIFL